MWCVGEILLTSIEKEGTWSGYDIEMIKLVTSSINIPTYSSWWLWKA
jgi:cyclase